MPLETPTAPVPKTSLKLTALTAVVLLAHGGLLFGTPMAMVSPHNDMAAAFSTRMIAPPAAEPVAQVIQTPTRRAAAQPRVPRPQAETAPTTLRDDVDPGPDLPATGATAPQTVASEDAYAAVSQLLAANGPPGDLQTSPPVTTPAPAPAATSTPAPAATRAASAGKTVQTFAFPPPLHLKYKINGEVKGFPYYVNGDLQWKQDGKSYEARMEVSHFLLGSRVQTSRGELGPTGLEPTRFGDKVRSERAAHFERSKGKITFSANTPDAPLTPGTQDQLSTLVQLGAMLGGSPSSFPEGTAIPFESVGPTSVESWVFKVGPQEKLTLPGGPVKATKLTREAMGDYGNRAEVWLAPSMGYLPVRIRLTESNGNFVDQKWSDTVSP